MDAAVLITHEASRALRVAGRLSRTVHVNSPQLPSKVALRIAARDGGAITWATFVFAAATECGALPAACCPALAAADDASMSGSATVKAAALQDLRTVLWLNIRNLLWVGLFPAQNKAAIDRNTLNFFTTRADTRYASDAASAVRAVTASTTSTTRS